MQTIVFSALVLFSAVVSAQPTLDVPSVLTCQNVNYTYNDGNALWSAYGRYWMSSKWGDNRSFATQTNDPLTLLRLTYGAPYGSPTEICTIQPQDRICTTNEDNGVTSIYTTIAELGQYVGVETVNGIKCNKWFASTKQGLFTGQYYLWTDVDVAFGFHMPVRYTSFESWIAGSTTTMQMDFLSVCTRQTPPDGTFSFPFYCPVLQRPVAASPRVVWRPPAFAGQE